MKLSVLFIIGGVLVASDAFALPPQLPNRSLTPGAVLTADRGSICTPGYSKTVRNVPAAEKNAVYREYGITSHRAGEYEVDHLISLELGGSNDIANLWPQSYLTEPFNAHMKDKLENRLHAFVCSGQISVEEAQHAIVTGWIAAYHHWVSSAP